MARSYSFGSIEVRPDERQLLVSGRPASVGARAFDLLLALVERRARVVTKNELLDIVWPGLVVEENNLQVQVSALRKILGPKVFTTIPGIGYRFSARLDGSDDVAGDAPKTDAACRQTNLPAATESLIARDAEIAALQERLAGHRLVTIVGAGGIGKTRLAQEVARGLVDRFTHGVWWVDLATVSSKAMIPAAIAHAAGLKLGGGDPGAELGREIADRDVLLVLDNCEYLSSEVASLARIVLAAAPAARLLVTSQELLKIAGEAAYPLEGLSLASPGDPLATARESGALQLLARRVQAVDPRFALDESNLRQAIELCGHLDGMALAIEMAAARIPFMGIDALVARLGERLDLLRNADPTAAPRYRTMRTTLEWSYSLLTPEQKALLRRLSSFVGSFRLDVALRFGADPDLDEWALLDSLSSLVDKSLLKVQQLDPPRYRLLEATRLFGLEQLDQHQETEACFRRHGEAMAHLNDEAMRAFEEEPESVCLRRYLTDYDDLLAAFDRACERDDVELAAANVMALARYDLGRGFYFLMRQRKSAALSMVSRASPPASARLWYCVAMGRFIACPGIAKLQAARKEVAAWKQLGETKMLYDALSRLATILGTAGHFEAGEEALSEARALEGPGWPPQLRAMYTFCATVVAAYGDHLDLFAGRIDEEETIASQTRFDRLAAVASMQRAEWALSSGNPELALKLSPIAIARYREIGNPFGLSNSLSSYCDGLLMAGHLEPVRGLLKETVPIALRNGIAGWAFDPLALYAARTGLARQAAKLLGYADACYIEAEEVRRPFDRRIAAACAGETEGALGGQEVARLRASGACLTPAEAEAMADEVLGARFKEDSGQDSRYAVDTVSS